MTFKSGQHVSIVPLCDGTFQFTFITNEGCIEWIHDDHRSKEEMQFFCDLRGLIVIPYIDLKIECFNKYHVHHYPKNWKPIQPKWD